ncbi:MAG: hypothetical protein RLZZ292_272 [Bacteroidota bacterium]|jgi:hypothetical protein
MNRYRIKLLFFFLIVIFYATASAQFRCGLTLGGELSEATIVPNLVGLQVLSEGYSNKNAVVGLRLEQKIFKKINLSLLGSVSSKYNIPIESSGIVAYTKIRFNNYKGSFLLSYSPFKFIRLGGGTSFSYIPIITQATDSNRESTFIKERKEIGYLLTLGFQYKPVLVEFYYYQGDKFFMRPEYKKFGLIQPINTFGVNLNYLFTLSKTKE